MKITVKRTDKRHTASHRYGYYVSIKPDNYSERGSTILEKFFELRAWCWETWGPSREAHENRGSENPWNGDNNDHWAWINDAYRARIYLGNKDDAAYFSLRWS